MGIWNQRASLLEAAAVQEAREARRVAKLERASLTDEQCLALLAGAIRDGRLRIDGKDLDWDGDIKCNSALFGWHPDQT